MSALILAGAAVWLLLAGVVIGAVLTAPLGEEDDGGFRNSTKDDQ